MKDYLSGWVEIIREAGTGPLALAALAILAVLALAITLLKKTGVQTPHLVVYVSALIVVVVLAAPGVWNAIEPDGAVSTPPPSAQASGPSCPSDDEAEKNIRWVVQLDDGAKKTYAAARNSGQSRYNALLTATGHDDGAQVSIKRIGETCAEAFAQGLGG